MGVTKSDDHLLSSPLIDHSQSSAIKRTGLFAFSIFLDEFPELYDVILLIIGKSNKFWDMVWWRDNMDSSGSYHHRCDRVGGAVPGVEHGAIRLDCWPFSDALLRCRHSHFDVSNVRLLLVSWPRARSYQEQIVYWSCWAQFGSDSFCDS